MRIYPFAIVLSLALAGCATHSAYDTAQFRQREYVVDRIALNEGGLSPSQISAISAAKPPSTFPVDLTLIVVKDVRITNELEQLFVSAVLDEVKTSDKIGRIVPIPKFLLPSHLNFGSIQELGVRTLCEYVVVFILDEESFFKKTKLVESQFQIASAVEYIIVDPLTTAILASDRLFSSKVYDESILKTGEKDVAQKEVFDEQGQLLGEKLAALFDGA